MPHRERRNSHALLHFDVFFFGDIILGQLLQKMQRLRNEVGLLLKTAEALDKMTFIRFIWLLLSEEINTWFLALASTCTH